MKKNIITIWRESDGKYGYHNQWDRLCTCGHSFCIHAAATPRPCFNEDTGIEEATGEKCDCRKFRLSVKYKNPAAVALGKLGGAKKTPAKIKAARLNGKKGGRPKKETV